jgi:hypothetical protein|tara:strand:- start:95 stop:541 length:447 start_codon:yes stop_codon:yes gene_type:complete
LITSFVSLINKLITFISLFFEIDRINHDDSRLYSSKEKKEVQNEEIAAKSEKPQIVILKKGESMETNPNLTEVSDSMTPLEAALESALMFGENMHFSVMAMHTSKNLSDPSAAPSNLAPEAYAAFCEYTAELFAVAAAARQELNDISA